VNTFVTQHFAAESRLYTPAVPTDIAIDPAREMAIISGGEVVRRIRPTHRGRRVTHRSPLPSAMPQRRQPASRPPHSVTGITMNGT